jgi:outer membrane receptor protein involved in Fe transport
MMKAYMGAASCAVLLMASAPAYAQADEAVQRYEIAAGPLDHALSAFARQSGQQILYTAALTAGRSSPGVVGDYTAEAALTRLLTGSGLSYRRTRPNVFVIFDPSARAEAEVFEPTTLDDVVVTGTYFRGADSPSPVTVVTAADIARSGRSTVAEALAALPQNFTGGAYEGSAGTGADRSGRNVQYATGMNLRGLGADATLVLINGRRIAGTGTAGDFADVSNIPTSAVERVDVLLDGASALYGADAVGGVVNIILKREFDGFETRTRIGGTSDGGAGERLFSQTGGLSWGSGHLTASYEFHQRDELRAADRRATADADLRPLGGSDWREIYAAPGNIMYFDPVSGSFEPTFAIPGIRTGPD